MKTNIKNNRGVDVFYFESVTSFRDKVFCCICEQPANIYIEIRARENNSFCANCAELVINNIKACVNLSITTKD